MSDKNESVPADDETKAPETADPEVVLHSDDDEDGPCGSNVCGVNASN